MSASLARLGEVVADIGGDLAAVLQRGQRILIAGSPPGTFPHELQRHPGLIFWPTTERSARDRSRLVPAEVGAVLVTRMVSHALCENLKRQAFERRLIYTATPLSPGGIKRLLQDAGVWVVDALPEGGESAEEEREAMPKPIPPPVALPAALRAGFKSRAAVVGEPGSDVAAAESTRTDIVALVDDAIAALQLVRECAVTVQADAERTRRQAEAFRNLRAALDGVEP